MNGIFSWDGGYQPASPILNGAEIKGIEEEIKQTASFRNNYHKACVNLIYTGKWIINLHSEILKSFGLTVQQYNILRILKGQYPASVTVKLIRERMLDKMSDASRIVEILNQKQLVKRTLNEEDRRKVDVVITQKGIDLLAGTAGVHKNMDDFLSALNENEIVLLNALLDKARS